MFEERVSRVKCTEGCAERGDRDAWRLTLRVNERNYFVRYVRIVLRLHPASVKGMRSLVLKRIAVDAVDAEDPDPPLLDVRTESGNHSLTFHFPLVAAARWEGENWRTIVAINRDTHVP